MAGTTAWIGATEPTKATVWFAPARVPVTVTGTLTADLGPLTATLAGSTTVRNSWFPGVDVTVEAGLSGVGTGYGVWGASTWGDATWGPETTWVDLSPHVRSIQIDRRFPRGVSTWEAGEATIEFNDPAGDLDPTNLSGAYVVDGQTQLRAFVPIRVKLWVLGVTYPLFAGYTAGDWKVTWMDGQVPVVTVTAADVWSLLAGDGIPGLSPVGAGESFGARVHRWLDAAGHTGPRDIEAGTVTMQATDLADRPVDGIALTADSEGGAVWVDADNTIVGEGRDALLSATRSIVPQATLGDGSVAGEIPCSSMTIGSRPDSIRNVVSFQRVGGTPQVHADPDSRAMTRLDRRETRTDLICQTDAQADRLASRFLAAHKDSEQTFTAVTIRPLADVPTIAPTVFAARMRDLFLVRRRAPGRDLIERYCHLSGVHISLGADLVVEWDLWSATPYRQFATSLWGVGEFGSALWCY